MNATQTRKPAELRLELVTAGRRELSVIYKRRWALQVMGVVREVKVRVFRNGINKCEEHGITEKCSHSYQLRKTCDEYGLWN